MKLNEQLKSLYSSKWKETCTALQALTDTGQAVTKPSYPFLLSVVKWENNQPDEEWYADADLKIMILERKPTVGLVNVMISEHRLLLYSIRT